MNMNKILSILFLCSSLVSITVDAQTFDEYRDAYLSKFNSYKTTVIDKYEEYRNRVNEEYSQFMRQAWTEYKANPARPIPLRKEPPKPVVKEPDDIIINPNPLSDIQKSDENEIVEENINEGDVNVDIDSLTLEQDLSELLADIVKEPKGNKQANILPIDSIIPVIEENYEAIPIAPLPKYEPMQAVTPGHSFCYYGVSCKVALLDEHNFTLNGITENDVADGWDVLSSGEYLQIVSQCVDYSKELNLSDWGYLRFLQIMTESFFSINKKNEAVLMQMYILAQSGYKVRIARCGEQLLLLLPIDKVVYNYSYLTVDGIPYYIINNDCKGQSFYLYNRALPSETPFSLFLTSVPMLETEQNDLFKRSLLSSNELAVSVTINPNLLSFYNDYPISSEWNYYALASLGKELKSTLYPTLKEKIANLSQLDAANLLLNFVQTAFDYKTDAEQFGYERPLFGDETFYYPYCDCEDRSILYSILVRDLLGLDVVLLNYPQHLATAVKFTEDVTGDYISLNGCKYVICDPTYIGAEVGNSMPNYRNVSATVIYISR